MRYLASIKYNGSKFYGFQRLNDKYTVQREIERVLTILNKKEVTIKGAGRTDRGVHAYGQVIAFDLDVDIPLSHIASAMNSLLDKSIYVNYVKEVKSTFHPRHDAKYKVYEYIINMGEYNPIYDDLIYNYNRKLDVKLMKKASKYLLGNHDFRCFVSGSRDNYDAGISNVEFTLEKDYLRIRFTGKSFYRYMVRNMVGALILVGEGKMNIDGIKEMLDKKDKIYNYITSPACGLYLMGVYY